MAKKCLPTSPVIYFPATPVKGLHYLTEQYYSHRYYVDLTPSVSDVFIGSSWRTVLIGGQRAGGRGYFALDVTNPAFDSRTANDIVMWEFTHEDLGHTYSRPQIGMMNDGTWVAIFGNGYNHTGTSVGSGGTDGNGTGGHAQLFIVNIATGNLIKAITTGAGDIALRNGLATPALADLDLNGTIDRAYAGDLQGNMWAFDLSGNTSSSWVLAHNDLPLFTTDGTDQPITTKPTLSFHPSEITIEEIGSVTSVTANEPNIMVFFGSGQYLAKPDIDSWNTDPTSPIKNHFYGVWDRGDDTADSALSRSSDLITQTLSTDTFASGDFRVLTDNSVDYNTKYGWHIELPDGGERIITNPIVRGKVVFFISSVPSNDPCDGGGYSYRFGVDLETGGTANSPVFDTNNDGIVDESDDSNASNAAGVLLDDGQFASGGDQTQTEGEQILASGEIKDLPDLPSPKTGRFSWQELLQ
jgi:type IV pilus assembly protein PilY1